jgi:hypothetical protein
MSLKKAGRLFRNTRAVNNVISNVILTGAVIVVGFSVLAWTQYRASSYNEQYGEAMTSDLARLRENLIFEYISHNKGTSVLSVYLLNSGTIDGVTVRTFYISNASWLYSSSSIDLKFFNNTPATSLSRESEAYFQIAPLNLVANSTYRIAIVTGRGSSFETTYIT